MNSLKLSELPSLPLGERHRLPDCPAVYFVTNGKEVLYIGQTGCLFSRWRSHHKFDRLPASASLAWLSVSDRKLLPSLERALIRRFQPSLNWLQRSGRAAYRIDLINRAMCAQGLTNHSLSKRSGIGACKVSEIRNGNPRVRIPTLKAVLDALGLTLREVFEPKPDDTAAEASSAPASV